MKARDYEREIAKLEVDIEVNSRELAKIRADIPVEKGSTYEKMLENKKQELRGLQQTMLNLEEALQDKIYDIKQRINQK